MNRVSLLAFLAGLGQLVMVLSGTIESWRGPDASAHVEAHGTQLHHAHDEATCPACIVQALHAKPERPSSPWPRRAAKAAPWTALVWSVLARTATTNVARAPPQTA
jgi:hypothetical protein